MYVGYCDGWARPGHIKQAGIPESLTLEWSLSNGEEGGERGLFLLTR